MTTPSFCLLRSATALAIALAALSGCNRNTTDTPAAASSPPMSGSTGSTGMTPKPSSPASSAGNSNMSGDPTTPALGTPGGGDGARATPTPDAAGSAASRAGQQ